MTQQEKIEIAKLVAWEVNQAKSCPHGIDSDTAASLKEFAATWQSGKKNRFDNFCRGCRRRAGNSNNFRNCKKTGDVVQMKKIFLITLPLLILAGLRHGILSAAGWRKNRER